MKFGVKHIWSYAIVGMFIRPTGSRDFVFGHVWFGSLIFLISKAKMVN